MAWRNMYGNIEVCNQDEGVRPAHNQRPQPATCDIYEEECVYEPIHGLDATEKKERINKTPRKPARRRNKGRLLFVTLSALLAVSLMLIFLLLGVGFTKYFALTAELQAVTSENGFLRIYASETFMLFNKEHNKCVEVQAPKAITVTPCNASSTAQQFQWLPGGRLLSIAVRLCVGVPKVANRLPVLLKPCSQHSDLQRWECPNSTLLAIRGAELYFNYGNNRQSRVMLFAGTGPWSQWVIHGTEDNVCSWSCEVSSPCPRGWTFFQNTCYYFSHSEDSWDNANGWCLSQSSLLVTIDSMEEQGYLSEAIRSQHFWLGLTDKHSEAHWQWVDGTALSNTSYRFWEVNEPDGLHEENCASIGDQGTWRDRSCQEKIPWVCERQA